MEEKYNMELLQKLMEKPENKYCFDCGMYFLMTLKVHYSQNGLL